MWRPPARFAFVLAAAFAAACAPPQTSGVATSPVVSFPGAIDPSCRNGRARLCDECRDQMALFDEALAAARAEGKTLLVAAGADWCIWCHVFDAYIKGAYGSFAYTYGEPESDARDTATMSEKRTGQEKADADRLAQFAADNFVIVHIDLDYAPYGERVLERAGAVDYLGTEIPFIFVVDDEGRFVRSFDHRSAQLRRDTEDWFRGHDRTTLTAGLAELRRAAQSSVN
jgi:hypothetical protein